MQLIRYNIKDLTFSWGYFVMKKTSSVVLAAACLVASFSCLVSAQEALSRGFEKARMSSMSEKVLNSGADMQVPQVPTRIEPGHEIGNVAGTNIEMKSYDHAVAGVINGGLVWGFFDEAKGVSTLTLRKYGQIISAEFKRQEDKSLGGVITSGEGESQRTTSVFLAGTESRGFKLRINGEEVAVAISPEGVNNGHFVNPTYSTVIGGKPVSYRIEVEGCLGYSIYMGMIVLGAYAH
jgi:hypothetical protein